MRKISFNLLIAYVCVGLLSWALASGVTYAYAGRHAQGMSLLQIINALSSLAQGVLLLILIYQIWQALVPEGRRTTPGAAVGLMFVPFYNFYWMFQVTWGWAVDFNRQSELRGCGVRVPQSLALAAPVLNMAGIAVSIAMLIETPAKVVPPAAHFVTFLALTAMVLFFFKAVSAINEINQVPPPLPDQQPSPAAGTLLMLSPVIALLGFSIGNPGALVSIFRNRIDFGGIIPDFAESVLRYCLPSLVVGLLLTVLAVVFMSKSLDRKNLRSTGSFLVVSGMLAAGTLGKYLGALMAWMAIKS